MPMTPAWAKNIARRVLWAAIEKEILPKTRLIAAEFFNNACAYCENPLPAKGWHLDHLLPVDQGGFNHISNRVPSCAPCNEKEKREKDWLEFLKTKATESNLFEKRKLRIQQWCNQYIETRPVISDKQREAWKRGIVKVANAIDEAWREIKESSV